MYPLTPVESVTTAASVVAFAAILHASFQVGASVLTTMSGHALGRKRSHSRLVRLMWAYIAGAVLMGLLLIAAAVLGVSASGLRGDPYLWLITSSVGIATAFGVLLAYGRMRKTLLWLPDALSDYLHSRARKTRRSAEAFALGLVTAVAEIPFLVAPLLFVAATLSASPSIGGIGSVGYALVTTVPLLVILIMIGSGTQVSVIERWRDTHARFIQLACAAGLLILSMYVFSLHYLELSHL